MHTVQGQMQEAARSDVHMVEQAARHIIEAGGKRLRPRLLFTAYEAAGGRDLDEALPLAAAIELIHTATLVHDDINDHATMRRGRTTINAKWGRTMALLTGDFLFTRAYMLMAAEGDRYNELLAEACTALVEGEVLQAVTAKSGKFDRDTYQRIIALKTASLFMCAARLGALKAGASEPVVAALGKYAYNLGMAFQIVDDVLDVVGDPELLGKPVHEDTSQKKLGLLSLMGDDGALPGSAVRDTDVMTLTLQAAGLVDEALAKARELVDRARSALAPVPESRARAALEALAESVVERDR